MSTFPHSYARPGDIMPLPNLVFKKAASSEEISEQICKKINFDSFNPAQEFTKPSRGLDDKIIIGEKVYKKTTFNPVSHVREFKAEIDIVKQYYTNTNFDENRGSSCKRRTAVIHTDPHAIKEIKNRYNVNSLQKIGTLLKNRELLRAKLKHVYSDYPENFKNVIRNVVTDYEIPILQAEPTLQPYLLDQVETLSLDQAKHLFDALAFRQNHIYKHMSKSFREIVDEAINQYSNRIDKLELEDDSTDMFFDTSSDEEGSVSDYPDTCDSFKELVNETLNQHADRIDEIEPDTLMETSSHEDDGNISDNPD